MDCQHGESREPLDRESSGGLHPIQLEAGATVYRRDRMTVMEYVFVFTPSCAVTVISTSVRLPFSGTETCPVHVPAAAITEPKADITAFESDLVAVMVTLSTSLATAAV